MTQARFRSLDLRCLLVAGCMAIAMGCAEESSPARQGDILLRAGRVGDAIDRYETAVRGGERTPEVLRKLGAAHQALWQWEPSVAYLREAVEAAPEDTAARVALTMALAATRQVDAARTHAERLTGDAPQLSVGPLLLAVLAGDHAQAKRANAALAALAAQTRKPAPTEVLLAQADLERRLGNEVAAKAHRSAASEAKLADAGTGIRLGFLYGRLGRFAPATRLLKAVVAEQPDNMEAQRQLAYTAIEVGDADTTLAALSSLPEAQRSAPGLDLVRGRAQLAKNNHKDALVHLKAAVQRLDAAAMKTPEGVQMRTLMAQAMGGAGDLSGARLELETLARQGSAPPETLLTLVDVLLRLDEDDAAVKRLEAMASVPETRVAALETLGKVHRDHRRPGPALEAFAQLAKAAPQSAQAAHLHAAALRATGDTRGAIAALQRTLSLDADRGGALGALLTLLRETGRTGEAEATLATQLSRGTPTAATRLAAAQHYAATGRKADALAQASAAVNQHGSEGADPVPVLLKAARIERGSGAEREALLHYEQVLIHLPAHPEALRGAGELRMALGELDRARQHFEALLKATPDAPGALNRLAYALSASDDQADRARGVSIARRAADKRPDSPIIADTLGWALHRAGRSDEGMPWIAKAARALPKEPEVLYHAGATRLALGDRARGKRLLKRALGLQPTARIASEARRSLEQAER